jgi:hypothetical protein
VNLELPSAELEALLRHALEHTPDTGDFRENAHLREALATLAETLKSEAPWIKKNGFPPGASGA